MHAVVGKDQVLRDNSFRRTAAGRVEGYEAVTLVAVVTKTDPVFTGGLVVQADVARILIHCAGFENGGAIKKRARCADLADRERGEQRSNGRIDTRDSRCRGCFSRRAIASRTNGPAGAVLDERL